MNPTEVQQVIRRPASTISVEDGLAQANAFVDELTDAMLELPEPHRTRFLKEVLPLRERIRAIQPK
ncbi:MAG TPA: hypothetical protein VMD27_09815 [Candidatus Aquilonibacter sp.]|nr:hypothetical protein [Candidatus Aquilonibacter sp.]